MSVVYSVEVMEYGNDRTDADGWQNTGWMLVSRDDDDPEDSARNRVLAIQVMRHGERGVPPIELVQECERLTAELDEA